MCRPALLATNAAVSRKPTAASSHQTLPRKLEALARGDGGECEDRKRREADHPHGDCGADGGHDIEAKEPEEHAESESCEESPADAFRQMRVFFRGGFLPGLSFTGLAFTGLSFTGLAATGPAALGVKVVAARITPTSVTARPAPRSAVIRSPLAIASATVSAG